MTHSKIKIPVYQPSLNGNEKKYVNECLESTWISSKGKFIAEFEQKFASYIHCSHATTVSNGTVALHLALLGLNIGPGDEVIVPTLTYVASVNAIAYVGATPVFVDSLETTWQIDPEDIKRKITSKTRAIMVVHLYGQPCDMHPIVKIAQDHNLFIIEDCAEAFGSKYKKQHVGTFGHISTFSFFGNKTLTTGEGGMVVTEDSFLFDRIVRLKGQGLAKNREYWHDLIGYNYRMTNLCAAIGVAQLERVEELIDKKRHIAKWYKQALDPVFFHDEVGDVTHSYWMCSILIDQRDDLRKFLAEKGVETRPVFHPIHKMPMYFQNQDFPVAEKLSGRGINLPSWPDLTQELVGYICNQIHKWVEQNPSVLCLTTKS